MWVSVPLTRRGLRSILFPPLLVFCMSYFKGFFRLHPIDTQVAMPNVGRKSRKPRQHIVEWKLQNGRVISNDVTASSPLNESPYTVNRGCPLTLKVQLPISFISTVPSPNLGASRPSWRIATFTGISTACPRFSKRDGPALRLNWATTVPFAATTFTSKSLLLRLEHLMCTLAISLSFPSFDKSFVERGFFSPTPCDDVS
mmetsp:Transcript_58411/g.174017  ORF Transcript_58411/g.174017 Transcript_58411/m.174017 type:complete len:200 (-) Transcript_58411:235-834(-)